MTPVIRQASISQQHLMEKGRPTPSAVWRESRRAITMQHDWVMAMTGTHSAFD